MPQILFCLLLGGLLSDYWVKGLVIGTSLLVCWALCLLLGTQWFGRIGLILTPDSFWYLFALPAIILGGSIPLLICRSAFGWKLIRANARSSQSRFSVEDLLLTTATIASVLFRKSCEIHKLEAYATFANCIRQFQSPWPHSIGTFDMPEKEPQRIERTQLLNQP